MTPVVLQRGAGEPAARRAARPAREWEAPRARLGVIRSPLLVAVTVFEHEALRDQFGAAGWQQVRHQLATALLELLPSVRFVGGQDGLLLLSVPGGKRAQQRLGLTRAAVAAATFTVNGERLRLTPLVGYTVLRGVGAADAERRAQQALATALLRLDLVPVAWDDAMDEPPAPEATAGSVRARVGERVRTPLQVLATYLLGLGLPFLGYVVSQRLGVGHAVRSAAYLATVAALLVTALAVYVEGLYALDPHRPPELGEPLPAASAVIAAYLPNESATIVDTVEAFLALDYPAGLQVVLAYNTPRPLPVEQILAGIAARDPRLLLLPVAGSTSKAQNVNAALDMVTGEMVGIFDADHHPEQGSFDRAWRWLSNGYGVVQGHCVVRNGDASWVSRMVAVEFESIYAVSHPGRARLHGFAIFGGSNGYWRTELLQAVRMRGSMLTEDIDASLRVTLRGEQIASDPGLISRELAPTRLGALAAQRLRWAQGWFQVSWEYGHTTWSSTRLSAQQRAGTVFMLGWREAYPWISLQIFPLLAYTALHPRQEPAHWFLPLFLLTTVLTLGVGPAQAVFAYLLGAPDVRRHRGWFVVYALVTAPMYSEFKNVLARVAQLKQLMGERAWRVTARVDEPRAGTLQEAA